MENCGKPFIDHSRQSSGRFCSNACKSAHRRKTGIDELPTHVSIAEGYLAHPDSNPESSVLDNVRVATIRNTGYLAPVYNLTVANTHEFFANGILVHNCMDALRYGISSYEEDYELDEWSWF